MEEPGKLLTPGTVVADRFRILDVLGEGGFAVVYLAEQLALDRLVALKILWRVASSRRQAEFEARFLQEAHAAARIDHPGVARVYDYGIWDLTGSPWIALEWLRGRDLATELNSRGPLLPSRALARMRELLAVLSVAHQKGIVHKDIKPPNLFLVNVASVAERTTLLDFGIARILDDDALRFTATGELLGTPHYLPPEYIRDLVVSPAFDVYQCGLVFAEMLIGRPVLADLNHAEAMSAHTGGRLNLPAALLDGPPRPHRPPGSDPAPHRPLPRRRRPG